MEFDPEKGHIMVRTILEILGKPQKHIEQTIADVIKNVKRRKGTWLLEQHISEAKKIEGLWSIFTELDIHFRSFKELSQFCFDLMPSSVEIMEPESLDLHGSALTALLNDLLAGLHNLDMNFKNLRAQAGILTKNNDALLKNIVLITLHYQPRDLKDLAGVVGVKELQLVPYLTRFMDEGIIILGDDDKYAPVKK